MLFCEPQGPMGSLDPGPSFELQSIGRVIHPHSIGLPQNCCDRKRTSHLHYLLSDDLPLTVKPGGPGQGILRGGGGEGGRGGGGGIASELNRCPAQLDSDPRTSAGCICHHAWAADYGSRIPVARLKFHWMLISFLCSANGLFLTRGTKGRVLLNMFPLPSCSLSVHELDMQSFIGPECKAVAKRMHCILAQHRATLLHDVRILVKLGGQTVACNNDVPGVASPEF